MKTEPPLEYLSRCSDASLQHFELARLNCAANLRKQMAALLDQLIDDLVDARLARRMIEHKAKSSTAPLALGPAPAPDLDPLRELLAVLAPEPRPPVPVRDTRARPLKRSRAASG